MQDRATATSSSKIVRRTKSLVASLMNKPWLTPLTLGWVTFLAYGIYIPWLGLYGDDWHYLWNYHLLGPQSFTPFVASDRPLSAWIYIISTALLGEHIWAYHVLALFLRFLAVLAFWWVLRLIWPTQKRQAFTVALLFAIYPGFKQQAIPIEFILHFTILGLFLASLGLMILAARQRIQGKPFWRSLILLIVSLLCASGMFSIEYFVGLELIRPIVLWLALRERLPDSRRRWRLIMRWYWPYLVLLAGFIYWRVFVQKFALYQPVLISGLQTDPLPELLNLAQSFFSSLYLSTIGAWLQVFIVEAGLRTLLFYLGVVGFSLITVGWLVFLQPGDTTLKSSQNPSSGVNEDAPAKGLVSSGHALASRLSWPAQAAGLGVISLAVAGIPFWVTGITISLSFPWDRGTLPFMLGASLLLASLLELISLRHIRSVLLIGLIALSIGAFARNMRTYLKDSAEQQQFIWQLVWRAPHIQAGTTFVTYRTSLDYVHDNGLTPIVNWTYAPGLGTNQFPYNVFELQMRENTPFAFKISTEVTPIERNLRSEVFHGSTAEMVLFYYNSPACLRIIRPQDESGLPALASLMKDKSVSNLAQISQDPSTDAQPPLVLQSEPSHTWCYYFEKADLARQFHDWQQVVALWETATQQSFSPASSSEYEPFIQAYAHLKNWDKALELSQKANANPQETAGLCAIWRELKETQAGSDLAETNSIEETLGCAEH